MNDLEFMKNPNEWPLYPHLPLKHSTRRNALAVLKHEELWKFSFYENVWLYNVTEKTPTATGGLGLLEKLFEDGWIVD